MLFRSYPSLSPAYAARLGRQDLATTQKPLLNYRYTMRDISILKDRITNLEYYTSLSLLEKSASEAKITTDTGVDRFKNGIFTDSFDDTSKAATYDPEHRIVFDPEEKSIRPVYKMDTIGYRYVGGKNVINHNPVITCNYSEILHYSQNYATKDINVERQSWLYLGTVQLFPPQDIWIDTTIMPDEKLSTSGIQIVSYNSIEGGVNKTLHTTPGKWDITEQGVDAPYGMTFVDSGYRANTTPGVLDILNNTTWGAWNKHVVGYKVYVGKVSSDNDIMNKSGQKLFTTYDAARADALSKNIAGGKGVTIEAVYDNDRQGTQ